MSTPQSTHHDDHQSAYQGNLTTLDRNLRRVLFNGNGVLAGLRCQLGHAHGEHAVLKGGAGGCQICCLWHAQGPSRKAAAALQSPGLASCGVRWAAGILGHCEGEVVRLGHAQLDVLLADARQIGLDLVGGVRLQQYPAVSLGSIS